MAKANLTLPNGTTVTIEGTSDEVAELLAKVSGPSSAAATPARTSKKSRGKTRPASSSTKASRKGPLVLVTELADEGFFKSKQTIGNVQKKLEEKGHIYAMESLSPTLLRLTRKRVLRRLKEKSGWVYVS